MKTYPHVIRRMAGPLLAAAFCSLLPAQQVEDLRVVLGKSVVIDYPEDIARVSTSNPDVVDAVAVTTRELLLNAKASGAASIVVWSRSGQRAFYNVSVEPNIEPLRRLFRESFPEEKIVVEAAKDTLSLNGRVSSKAVAERAVAMATPLAKAVVNNLQVAAPPADRQILLRVRFAELNRSATMAFGVNILSTGALNTPGVISTGQFTPPRPTTVTGTIPGQAAGTTSTFSISDALNIFAFRPDLNLAVFIKALQTQGLLQILAEPNLVTSNGKEASFLVGGEFPIPVLQGGANAGAVTVQFREFGIRLTFNPLITENGTIRLYVKPEVSTIDLANAVTLSGFTIPALATRRMETNVELAEGQSFVIGGLIDDRVNETISRIPGLASIPILGELFKSRAENKSKTELIVMVTPEIAKPMSAADAHPGPFMPKEFLAPLPQQIPVPAKQPEPKETKKRGKKK